MDPQPEPVSYICGGIYIHPIVHIDISICICVVYVWSLVAWIKQEPFFLVWISYSINGIFYSQVYVYGARRERPWGQTTAKFCSFIRVDCSAEWTTQKDKEQVLHKLLPVLGGRRICVGARITCIFILVIENIFLQVYIVTRSEEELYCVYVRSLGLILYIVTCELPCHRLSFLLLLLPPTLYISPV